MARIRSWQLLLILCMWSPNWSARFSGSALAQTVSIHKYCTNCKKEVSPTARPGQRCPYCKIIWGREILERSKSAHSGTSANQPLSTKNKPQKQAIDDKNGFVRVFVNKHDLPVVVKFSVDPVAVTPLPAFTAAQMRETRDRSVYNINPSKQITCTFPKGKVVDFNIEECMQQPGLDIYYKMEGRKPYQLSGSFTESGRTVIKWEFRTIIRTFVNKEQASIDLKFPEDRKYIVAREPLNEHSDNPTPSGLTHLGPLPFEIMNPRSSITIHFFRVPFGEGVTYTAEWIGSDKISGQLTDKFFDDGTTVLNPPIKNE